MTLMDSLREKYSEEEIKEMIDKNVKTSTQIEIGVHEMTIKQPTLEELMIANYTTKEKRPEPDEPERYVVCLKSGVQSFQFAEAEDERHAEWYQDMMGKALANIILEQRQRDK